MKVFLFAMISVVQRNERVGEEGKKFKFQLFIDGIMTQKSQEHDKNSRRKLSTLNIYTIEI